MSGSAIAAVSGALPERVVPNEELAGLGWAPREIEAKTGIVARHVADHTECASDLAVSATERLLSMTHLPREAVDFLLVCTQTPDYLLPTTACLVQDRIGLPVTCGALDINLGCSGYVYGLAVAHGLICAGLARHVVLVTADTYTRLIHPHDRSARVLFGDGASATWVCAADENRIGPFVFGTDGSGAEHFMLPAGGLRLRCSPETRVEHADPSGNVRTLEDVAMRGPEIFNFSIQRVPEVLHECLRRARLGLDDVDFYVFHQANRFMLDHLRRKIGIPEQKMVLQMRDTGNTVSSSL